MTPAAALAAVLAQSSATPGADLALVAAVLAAAGAVAWWWHHRQGAIRSRGGARLADEDRHRLGAPGGRQLLVLFTAPTCARCPAARDVLDDIARSRPEVATVEASVDTEHELARAHRVLRTPTVLVVRDDGAVRASIGGVPDRRALAALVDG